MKSLPKGVITCTKLPPLGIGVVGFNLLMVSHWDSDSEIGSYGYPNHPHS